VSRELFTETTLSTAIYSIDRRSMVSLSSKIGQSDLSHRPGNEAYYLKTKVTVATVRQEQEEGLVLVLVRMVLKEVDPRP
jgi:hypothetical protein